MKELPQGKNHIGRPALGSRISLLLLDKSLLGYGGLWFPNRIAPVGCGEAIIYEIVSIEYKGPVGQRRCYLGSVCLPFLRFKGRLGYEFYFNPSIQT